MSPRSDDGAVTAFVAVLALALFAVAGLVVDGGRTLAAREQAEAVAEQAARAGAEEVSVAGLHTGTVVLDPVEALSAAQQALHLAGTAGTVAVTADQVTVTVATRVPTTMLGIVGISSMQVQVVATASDLHGVTRGD